MEAAGLAFGDTSFVKAGGDYTMFQQLNEDADEPVVFGCRLGVGLLKPMGESRKSQLPDRYYMGGASSLRGFQAKGAGPRSSALDKEDASSGDSLGGDVKVDVNADMSFPLFSLFPVPSVLASAKAHFFTNVGSLSQWHSASLNGVFNENVRASLGMGVRLPIPALGGNVEFNYSVPVKSLDSDRVQRFQLGLSINPV